MVRLPADSWITTGTCVAKGPSPVAEIRIANGLARMKASAVARSSTRKCSGMYTVLSGVQILNSPQGVQKTHVGVSVLVCVPGAAIFCRLLGDRSRLRRHGEPAAIHGFENSIAAAFEQRGSGFVAESFGIGAVTGVAQQLRTVGISDDRFQM